MKNLYKFLIFSLLLMNIGFSSNIISAQVVATLDSYMGTYSNTITYQKNNIVMFNNGQYISIISNNLNNEPDISLDAWTNIGTIGGSMVWPTTPGVAICTGTPCTAWTITKPLAGTGSSIVTGPSTSVNGHWVQFVGTTGQIADGGADIPVLQGGTGATSAGTALSNLLSNPAVGSYIVICSSTTICTSEQASFSNLAGNMAASQGPTTLTGILYDTAGTLSAAIAANFPILNQNTTGTSANITGIVTTAHGGTGNAGVTGIRFANNTTADTVTTTAQMQTAIGSGVYDASGAAATAQTNAEAFSAIATNLTSGTVALARLPTIPYTQLSDAPTIPTNTNQLTNGSGFITSASFTLGSTAITNGSTVTNVSGLTLTSPTLITPSIGAAIGTSLHLSGGLTVAAGSGINLGSLFFATGTTGDFVLSNSGVSGMDGLMLGSNTISSPCLKVTGTTVSFVEAGVTTCSAILTNMAAANISGSSLTDTSLLNTNLLGTNSTGGLISATSAMIQAAIGSGVYAPFGTTGSGTVNSGTIFSPAYYTATGTVVGGVTPFAGLAKYSTSAAPTAATPCTDYLTASGCAATFTTLTATSIAGTCTTCGSAAISLPFDSGTQTALPTNSAGWAGPTASGGTSYLAFMPATASAGVLVWGTPTTTQGVNGVATSIFGLAGNGTTIPTASTISSTANLPVCTAAGGAITTTGCSAGGTVSNFYTSTTFSGIGPTAFTPTHTLDIQDTTPTTGSTNVVITIGAAQNNPIFAIVGGFGGTDFSVDQFDRINFGSTVLTYGGEQLFGEGFASVVGQVQLAAQTVAVPTTTIYTSTNFNTVTLLQVNCYLNETMVGVGTVAVTLGWNDGTADQSITAIPATVLASGAFATYNGVVALGESTSLTYSATAPTTGAYNLTCTATRVI